MSCNFKDEIMKKCQNSEAPCSITFRIGESFTSFDEVVDIISSKGFTIEDFVDDYLCVMSRDNKGFNEAIKIEGNTIQIQALRKTLLDLSSDLSNHCKKIE
jgi:hypothetical protein